MTQSLTNNFDFMISLPSVSMFRVIIYAVNGCLFFIRFVIRFIQSIFLIEMYKNAINLSSPQNTTAVKKKKKNVM